MKQSMPKYPCRNCIHFYACGEKSRTIPCYGRKTRKMERAEQKLAEKLQKMEENESR